MELDGLKTYFLKDSQNNILIVIKIRYREARGSDGGYR